MNLFARYCIGIDIGEKTINLVELKRKRRNLDITNIATGSNLKKLVANCHSRQAVLALPNSHVIQKTIFVDKHLTDTEINYYIQSNLHTFFSAHPRNLYVDFISHEKIKNNQNQKAIMIFATKSESINTRLKLIKQAGLTTKIITLEHDAFREILPIQKTCATIHTKESNANFSVFHENQVIFSADIFYDTTSALQAFIQHSFDNFSEKNPEKLIDDMYTLGDDCPKKINNSTLIPLAPPINAKQLKPKMALSYALAKRGLR